VVVYEIANVDATPVTSLRTGVPLDLERMITKAMAKSPDERYQHMDEMLVDLKRLAKGSQTAPPPLRHTEYTTLRQIATGRKQSPWLPSSQFSWLSFSF
jgi:hypothetical protein